MKTKIECPSCREDVVIELSDNQLRKIALEYFINQSVNHKLDRILEEVQKINKKPSIDDLDYVDKN